MNRKTRNRTLWVAGICWGAIVLVALYVLPGTVFQPGIPKALPKYVPHDGPLRVVTSVEVWADIAREVGGKYVTAEAILTNANQDPHTYEASPRDQLRVNSADLTVKTGGFYDNFFFQMEQASPNQRRYMQADMTMVSVAYSKYGSPVSLNDHVWYDLKSVKSAAGELAYRIQLGLPDKAAKQAIRNQTRAFQDKVGKLEKLQGQLRERLAGKRAILTEGFAAYLLYNLKITDATPAGFKNAVDQETDASASVLEEMRKALAAHRVDVVVVNQQTESAQTSRLVRWAKAAGVPVVRLSELLPKGESYLTWMRANLERLGAAVK